MRLALKNYGNSDTDDFAFSRPLWQKKTPILQSTSYGEEISNLAAQDPAFTDNLSDLEVWYLETTGDISAILSALQFSRVREDGHATNVFSIDCSEPTEV